MKHLLIFSFLFPLVFSTNFSDVVIEDLVGADDYVFISYQSGRHYGDMHKTYYIKNSHPSKAISVKYYKSYLYSDKKHYRVTTVEPEQQKDIIGCNIPNCDFSLKIVNATYKD